MSMSLVLIFLFLGCSDFLVVLFSCSFFNNILFFKDMKAEGKMFFKKLPFLSFKHMKNLGKQHHVVG